MVIQIIPKQQEKSFSILNVLFYLSLVLLFASMIAYFVLFYFLKNTEEKISSLDEQIAAAAASPEAAVSQELILYQGKINNFSSLMSAHKYSSQVFPLIESLVHPKVSFSSFSFDMETRIVTVSGKTDNFLTLGQQTDILKGEKLIQNVELSDISFDEDGKVSFAFELVLDPQVFIKSSATTTINE